MLVKIESFCRKTLNIKLGVLLELKEFGSSKGDREPSISAYHISQKLRGAPRLLFSIECV